MFNDLLDTCREVFIGAAIFASLWCFVAAISLGIPWFIAGCLLLLIARVERLIKLSRRQ